MTVINDTRVVRLQRTAARTGHQHSGDERIIEVTADEIVTASDVVSLPPGSLISLQRGPAQGHTEEGSILNATSDDIGGVAGGQTTSVSFDSEDTGASAASIFVTEIDFADTLSASGEYAVNYKTFQIKTYDPVPTTVGSRILVSYTWAPIREFLAFGPEDLDPDLEAFGDGPHTAGGGGDGYTLLEGCGINFDFFDGYREISVDVESLAGNGLTVVPGPDGCEQLAVDIDGYAQGCTTIYKLGSEAEDPDYRSIFSTDGYTYAVGLDRLLVSLNGLLQFSGVHYTETSSTSITFTDPVDRDDEIVICILPGSLGDVGDTDLQEAYDNTLGLKKIILDDGSIIIEQSLSTDSVLKLNTTSALNPARSLDISHEGDGEAVRAKSVVETKPTLLIQKDAASRDTVLNTIDIERTTSHISGGLTGIGSAVRTQLEDTGGNLFTASRIVTGTEDAADSSEKAYLSLELVDDGVLAEHIRITSTGRLGLNTSSPEALLHAQGDGYFSGELETAGKVTAGTNNTLPALNVPVFSSDPSTLEDGDVWITDNGGTRQLHVRISGSTYSVTLT